MSERSVGTIDSFRWVCAAITPLAVTHQPQPGSPAMSPDWEDIMHVASEHLVVPNLYVGLRIKGLLTEVPADFCETLEAFQCLNTLRNGRLRRQMLEISSTLNAIGVTPIWLKGANNLMAVDWQKSGRMMLDLDFWVPDPTQRTDALKCLDQLGYFVPSEYSQVNFDASQHVAPRFRDGELARIEVHQCIVDPKVAQLLPDREALTRAEWIHWEGHRVGRLSLPDRLMHSYIQCTEMSGDTMFRARISLRKVLDFVQLALACGDAFHSRAFTEKLEQPPWCLRSRQFLSYVEHDFGLVSPLVPDSTYLFRRRLNRQFPRLMYGRLFLHRFHCIFREGRIGSPLRWRQRLSNFLSNYSQ